MGFGRTDCAVAIRIVTPLAQGVRHGLGNHRLAVAGRAVQQHALRRLQIVTLKQRTMLERQLDGVPDTTNLTIQAADVGERDVRGLLQHQILVALGGQRFDGEADGRIDDNAVALIDTRIRERAGTADEHGIAGGVGNDQSTVVEYLLDTANLAHGVSVALLDQHELLVEHHGGPGGQAGGVDVGGHRHHHAAGAGNDFGRRVLDAVFIGAGGIDLDHGGEGERRLSELGEL